MVIIRPFPALRPREDLAQQMASVPYDVINRREAAALAEGNPYSFLHINRSEIDLPDSVAEHTPKVYAKARENLERFLNDGALLQDEQPFFYIYRLNRSGHIQTGLVAAASIDDYLSGAIKKHEHTRPAKEQDRIDHFTACRCHTEGVFLTFKNDGTIPTMMAQWCQKEKPLYDFTADDGIHHQLWQINDNALIEALQQAFKNLDALYIADGHHRSASAAKVCQQYRQNNPNFNGDEPFNGLLAVIFPHDELQILDYNRLVKDLRGLSEQEFVAKLEQNFLVKPVAFPYRPEKAHVFGLCLRGKWYKLTARDDICQNPSVEGLDAAILQNVVLNPILGIADPRRDERIDFIGGTHSLLELQERTLNDMAAAFVLHPVSIDDVLAAADANKVMPAKSTWFEPKLRSGLFLQLLD